jgi:hypothetical protein
MEKKVLQQSNTALHKAFATMRLQMSAVSRRWKGRETESRPSRHSCKNLHTSRKARTFPGNKGFSTDGLDSLCRTRIARHLSRLASHAPRISGVPD